MTYHDMMGLTEVFCNTVGWVIWKKQRDEDGRVTSLWLLPPQNIRILRDWRGHIVGYQNGLNGSDVEPCHDEDGRLTHYRNRNPDKDDDEVIYLPRDVVHFSTYSMADPYGGVGDSPLRAIWQRVQLGRKELSSWEAIVSQMAKPAWLITPPEGEILGPDGAERIAKEFQSRFYQGGNGGAIVFSDALKATPISYPPKDQSGMQLYEQIVEATAAVYHFPMPMIRMNDSNYASAKCALSQYQQHCLRPRANRKFETLTLQLVREYDDTLAITYDDFVVGDEQAEIAKEQVRIAQVQNAILTPNEARKDMGLPPRIGGDVAQVQVQQIMPQPQQAQQPQGSKPNDDEQADAPITNDLRSTVGGLQAIASLQASYYSGQVPREAAVANVRLLFGFSDAEAEELFPAVAPTKLTEDGPQGNEPQGNEPQGTNAQDAPSKAQPPKQADAPAEQGKAVSVKVNERKRPSDEPLVNALKAIFEEQRRAVLRKIGGKTATGMETKALPALPNLDDWDSEMTARLVPIMRIYWDEAAVALIHQLGLTPDVFTVVQPLLRESLAKATLAFCAATNATTSLDLQTALDLTRQELEQGMSVGESYNQLSQRVNAIFDTASMSRSYRIAETESTRAVFTSETTVAKESGLPVKKKWLPDSMACPICLGFAAKGALPLDQPFGVAGEGPYAITDHPPGHPSCRCALTYEVIPE
jgi:hypothetical protein